MSTAKLLVFGPDDKPYESEGDEDIDVSYTPPSEAEKKSEKLTIGKGLKIMTPKQLITRLPILLAQLEAGNNSQKLKNEIS